MKYLAEQGIIQLGNVYEELAENVVSSLESRR